MKQLLPKLVIVATTIFAAAGLYAGTVYWDINGTTAGAGGSAPAGSWGTATATWGNSAGTAATANWVNGDTAIFAAGTDASGSYTVTANTPITVAGITREEGTPTISALTSPNIITLQGGNLAVDSGSGTIIINALFAPTDGVITKSGSGIGSFGTVQTSFAGKWVCNAGSLSFPGDTRIGVVPAGTVADQITLNGPTARLRSSTATVSFDVKRGITLGSGGGGFDHASTVTLTWNGPITGSSGGALIMSGAGALVLTSTANNYDGATTISNGTLRVGASGVIPDTSVVSLTAAGVQFHLNGFDETVKSVSGTAGTIAVGANALTVNNPAGESYSSVFTGTPGGKVVKNGSGALSLSGSSTGWTGEWVVNDGTIGVGGANVFGNAAGATVTINGGKLANTGTGGRSIPAAVTLSVAADFSVDDSIFTASANGQILFNGPATLKNGNRTINVDQPNGQTVNLGFAGVLGEDAAGRGIIKNGTGILALNNAANTFSGNITLNAGTLSVDGDGSLGTGAGTLNLSGGRFNVAANRTAVIPNPIDLTTDSAITTSSAAATVNADLTTGSVSGSAGALTFRNDGADGASDTFKPRFSGSFTFARPIVIDNGTIGKTELNSFNLSGDQTFDGVISGTGSYNRGGAGGRTIFTQANTYSGGTTVNAGTLIVNNTTGSGTGSGSVAVNSGGTLGGNGTISGVVTVAAGGTVAPGTSIGTLTLDTAPSLSGTTSMEINKSGATLTGDKLVLTSGTLTFGGTLTVTATGDALNVGDTFDLFDAASFSGSFSSLNLPTPASGAWDASKLSVDGTITVVCTPTITTQPSSQTVCSNSSAGFTVAAGGVQTYAWRKLGGGWGTGNAWTFSNSGGSLFLGSSTDNNSGDPASNGGNDINTGGKAWAIYNNGGVSDAVRNFSALAVGQTFSLDLDNGNIQSGGTVGLGIQNSSGENRLEVYFTGGDANYTVKDASTHDSTIGFTRTGLRVEFTLTSADTYSVKLTRYSDNATATLTGTLAGTGGSGVSRVRVFNANAGDCGFGCNANTVYFNNLKAGAFDDDASGYSSWSDGDNKGSAPLANGGHISGATTATLTIDPADGTDLGSYDVVMYNTCGQTNSSAATLTLNLPATADAGPDQTVCASSPTVTLAGAVGGAASSGSWSGGAGVFSPDNTTLNAAYTPTAGEVTAGSVTLTLTTDDPSGPCGAVGDSMTITINAVATVNAGLDQLIQAGGTATLAGSKGGGATSATWSGGGGAFSPDNMTLNAIYTPSQAEVDAGEVTLTLTTDDPAGPCPAANDSVLIDINRPPVANVAAYDCTRGLSVKILVTGLLSSSTSDVDGDARSLTSVGAAGNGTATVVNGYIVYSNNGSGVSDSFAYNISDGRGGSASASINITIVEPSEQSQNKLSDPQVIGGGPDVRLRFLGIPGYQYALEWTHDLTPIVTWTPLQTNQADVTGLVTYTNTPSGMADYYRTRWVP